MKTQSYRVVVYLLENTEHKYIEQGCCYNISCFSFGELLEMVKYD